MLRVSPRLCLLATLLWPGLHAADSHPEDGRPLLRRFTPKDYRSHYQVWAATQASDGRMWFGSLGGAVIFDGHAWTKADVPTSFVRQLVEGPRRRMFVGAEEALGYLEPDGLGGQRYVSLLDKVPAEARPIGLGRRVVRAGDDIFVACDRQVFRIRGDDVKAWSFDPARRNVVDTVGGEVFLLRGAEGIFRLRDDTFEKWVVPPGMERPQFTFLLPADGAAALLVLGNDGLFRLDAAGRATPWGQAARAVAGSAAFFSGKRLRDGSYAFGTINSGLVLLSADGTAARRIATADGLPADIVPGVGEDLEGGLWAATQNGIARLDRALPVSVFDDTNGLGEALTLGLERQGDTLYTVFANRLLRLEPARGDARARWVAVPGLPEKTKVNRILAHPRGLLVGADGVHLLAADGWRKLRDARGAVSSLAFSAADPDHVFVGWDNAVTVLRHTDGTWRDDGPIPGIDGEPPSMCALPDGTLWVATSSRGVFRARRPEGQHSWAQAEVRRFHADDDSLPRGHGWVFVEQTPFGPRFATEKGVCMPDARGDRLVPDAALAAVPGAHPLFEAFVRAETGDTWATNATNRISPERPLVRVGRRADGGYRVEDAPAAIRSLLGLSGLQTGLLENSPAGPILWARGLEFLLRIEVGRLTAPDRSVAPVLVAFRAEGRPQPLPATADTVARLGYSTEPVVLRYASVRYGGGGAPLFQTRLLGFRDHWSEASPGTEAVFTNLEGGPFAFEVRTVDADGRVGPAAALRFSVAPPWHRAPWAVAFYLLAAAGTVAGLIRWRLRHAERERLRLEQLVARRTDELRLAKDAADEANRAKSAFLANMSHELRTPLNGVIGYAQVLMKDRELTPRNRERVQIVQTSGEHLLRMINEVLDFSKIEAGRMELAPTPFHLPQLLRDIAAAISPRFEQKQLAFRFEPAPTLPDLVLGDPLKLRQVLDNLLGNALKFTPRGEVCLTVETADAAGETLRFRVSDTGVGIGPADRARLFQPFQQAVDGRPPEPGTGLGLAIARRLVELMGGALDVESEPGRGSVFTFAVRLPVLAADALADSRTGAALTGYRGRRRRILVVDDVATNRAVLRELLAPLGFELTEAASGTEALAVAPALAPDLVLLDLRMPGLDGFELARRLRALPGGTALKLIAMSASVLSFSRDDAFAAGCDDFLPKPFRETDLLARIGQALRLEWTGESGDVSPASAASPDAPATALPAAVVADLLAVARRGEIAALRRRLAEHRGDPLADALDALAKSYRMENIRALLEAQSSAPRPPS
jgi:signal transduction histidine kinase/DNA-binding NarL/FixJ family response regulator